MPMGEPAVALGGEVRCDSLAGMGRLSVCGVGSDSTNAPGNRRPVTTRGQWIATPKSQLGVTLATVWRQLSRPASRLSSVRPDEVSRKHGRVHSRKRLACVFVKLDATTVIEVLGADGAVGAGTYVNEDLIIGDDAVEYLMPQFGTVLAIARQP